jgi:signal transduction histidine kinase
MKLLERRAGPTPQRWADDITDLPRWQHLNARRFIKVCMVFSIPINLVELSFGLTDTRRTLVFLAVFNGVWLLALAAGRHASTRRRPEAYLFGVSVVLVIMLCVTPWLSIGHHRHMEDVRVLYALPLAVSTFALWDPRITLLFGAIAVPASVLGEWWATGVMPADAVNHLLLGASLTAVGALSNAFTRRLWSRWVASREQLTASDRMVRMGKMTAGIAHELKTPLAATDGALLTLRRLEEELTQSIGHPQVSDDDLGEIVREMSAQLELANRANQRVAGFVGAIRQHTRSLVSQGHHRFSVREQVALVQVLFAHRLKLLGVGFEYEGDAGAPLFGDPGKFDQILTNLLGNALDAIGESGVGSRVVARAEQRPDGVTLQVMDDGPGVPPAIRDRIFDYLFTTRSAANGTGLGLAICRDIATGEFSGSLEFAESGKGARFVLRLRDVAESARQVQPASAFVPAA